MPKPKSTVSIVCTQASSLQNILLEGADDIILVFVQNLQNTADIIAAAQKSDSQWIVLAPDEATEADIRALWLAAEHESFAEFPVMAMGREHPSSSPVSRLFSYVLGSLRRVLLGDRVGQGRLILIAKQDFQALPPYQGFLDFISVLARYAGIRVVSVPVSFTAPDLSLREALRLFVNLWGTFWLKGRWLYLRTGHSTPPGVQDRF